MSARQADIHLARDEAFEADSRDPPTGAHMKTGTRIASSLLALVLASGMAFAKEGTRTELRREDLSGAPGMEVVLSVTEIKPGEEIPLHFHHGIEAGYVLEGGEAQNAAGAKVSFTAGTPIMNLRDV
jgi:anti-sigma factor ChrR (cupin superfamily)